MLKPKGMEPSKPSEPTDKPKEKPMEKVKGTTFDKQNVVVDGKEFEDCTFRQCTLIYKGGDLPQLLRCNIAGTCDWQFQEAAGRTLLFISKLYHGGAKAYIEGFIQGLMSQPTGT